MYPIVISSVKYLQRAQELEARAQTEHNATKPAPPQFPVPPVFVIPRARELIHRRLKADCLLCQPRGDPVTQHVRVHLPVLQKRVIIIHVTPLTKKPLQAQGLQVYLSQLCAATTA